jgi:hypothetical protein
LIHDQGFAIQSVWAVGDIETIYKMDGYSK